MFDIDAFSNILQKIASTYESITEFADKSNVNRTYISKYINKKLDTPPSPKVLMKIANNSNNITTYNELMNICGFTTSCDNIEETREAQSVLSYDNLTKKLSLSNKDNVFLKSLFLEYNKLRNTGINIEEIQKQLLYKIEKLPINDYNIEDMKIALKMYILSVSANNVAEYIYETRAELDSEYNFIDYINKIHTLEKDFPNCINNQTKYYMCPVYGQISAGQPNWAEECLEGELPIDPDLMGIINPEEYFFLRVNGESMNKIINNGAFALIHKQDIVDDGEIAVVLVNGYDATLKKFTRQGNMVILEPQSTDESFKTQVYDKNTPIKILGKYAGKMEINK